MMTILQEQPLDKLPVVELKVALEQFIEPVTRQLPEKRLREVVKLAVQGMIASRSPLVTHMACGVAREKETIWPLAKRLYRFLWNHRFNHRTLLKGLYGIAQQVVAEHQPAYLVVALDPVNFEKPYTRRLEGVCTVQKSTPPGAGGRKRLTSGYPALTATVVNLPEPVVTYAHWFSYQSPEFVSENRELYRAIRITRALFPALKLRFVGDAGLDDQKVFRWMAQVAGEFIIRAGHHRTVEVYNPRLDRWEEERLDDLVATVPFVMTLRATFTHARKERVTEVQMGWFQIRLPKTGQVLWALVIHDPGEEREIVLLTNIPILTPQDAQTVYLEWRHRPQIEHTYRFDQEEGLDVERIQVRTLERMRRLFVLLLIATLFIYHINSSWPRAAVLWLKRLGGKLGLSADCDGPYVLLAGIRAVFITAATLTFAAHHPFPRGGGTCG